ncbi:MAG TPA: hypothetical protein VFD87_01455, partial [Phototrophicaceae bacterium]|nr:hypothetical protein [Phototrophicaceae bacterium]
IWPEERRRVMAQAFGIAIMVIGAACVLSARLFPERRALLEGAGTAMFIVGLIIWTIGTRLMWI